MYTQNKGANKAITTFTPANEEKEEERFNDVKKTIRIRFTL